MEVVTYYMRNYGRMTISDLQSIDAELIFKNLNGNKKEIYKLSTTLDTVKLIGRAGKAIIYFDLRKKRLSLFNRDEKTVSHYSVVTPQTSGNISIQSNVIYDAKRNCLFYSYNNFVNRFIEDTLYVAKLDLETSHIDIVEIGGIVDNIIDLDNNLLVQLNNRIIKIKKDTFKIFYNEKKKSFMRIICANSDKRYLIVSSNKRQVYVYDQDLEPVSIVGSTDRNASNSTYAVVNKDSVKIINCGGFNSMDEKEGSARYGVPVDRYQTKTEYCYELFFHDDWVESKHLVKNIDIPDSEHLFIFDDHQSKYTPIYDDKNKIFVISETDCFFFTSYQELKKFLLEVRNFYSSVLPIITGAHDYLQDYIRVNCPIRDFKVWQMISHRFPVVEGKRSVLPDLITLYDEIIDYLLG